eukprot:306739-Rhodomonas_salina.3
MICIGGSERWNAFKSLRACSNGGCLALPTLTSERTFSSDRSLNSIASSTSKSVLSLVNSSRRVGAKP